RGEVQSGFSRCVESGTTPDHGPVLRPCRLDRACPRTGPKDASALIRRYQNACSGVVAGFDGYVAKFMGDGLLAYFGYPQANEDAAEQAVRSAFAIIDAVGDLRRPDGRRFAVRVGIATGTVVIGDM